MLAFIKGCSKYFVVFLLKWPMIVFMIVIALETLMFIL